MRSAGSIGPGVAGADRALGGGSVEQGGEGWFNIDFLDNMVFFGRVGRDSVIFLPV